MPDGGVFTQVTQSFKPPTEILLPFQGETPFETTYAHQSWGALKRRVFGVHVDSTRKTLVLQLMERSNFAGCSRFFWCGGGGDEF